MSSRAWIVRGALVALLAAAVFGARAAGQERARQDVLDTLLVEVRGLRAAIEELASSGARVQLAMGRLQIQEQRVTTLVRRLEDSRQVLAGAEREAAQRERDLARLEALPLEDVTVMERRAVADQARELKRMLTVGAADLQRLRAEDAQLAETVSVEQQRWATFNQALDDLERSLRERR